MPARCKKDQCSMWAWLILAFLLAGAGLATAAAQGASDQFILAEGTRWETPYYVQDSGVEGPTVVVVGGVHGNFADGDSEEAAELLLDSVNGTIEQSKKRFVRLEGTRDGGRLVGAAADRLRSQALICETTRKSQPVSLRTRQHRMMVRRLLMHLKMLPPEVSIDWLVDRARSFDHLAIAIYDARGTGGSGVRRLTRLFSGLERASVVHVGPDEMNQETLAQFDIVVFPGGSGSAQGGAIGLDGREAVAQFVKQGGGYLGICAGAYLATHEFSWGLKILDAKTVSPKWRRGKGDVEVEMTDEGRTLLGWSKPKMTIRYHNGPILMPAGSDALPDYTPVAHFRTEVADHGAPEGIMVDSPAIVASRCGKGRVICFSPHAEGGDEEAILVRAVRWLAADER